MSKNKFLSYYAFLSIIFLISSCTYNSEEDLYPPEEPMEEGISYLNDVLPIIETNCYACHDALSQNGGINLEGYDNLVIRVEDGSLEGSIRHEEEWLAMPLAASKLSDNLIQQISDWIDQGYPNN